MKYMPKSNSSITKLGYHHPSDSKIWKARGYPYCVPSKKENGLSPYSRSHHNNNKQIHFLFIQNLLKEKDIPVYLWT